MAGLDHTVCATSIVNTITAGQSIPQDTKNTMKEGWIKIIDALFNHITSNMVVTITVPDIPSANFNLTLAATVDIGGTSYNVDFTTKTVADVSVPDATGGVE
jgi:hypothetical protein